MDKLRVDEIASILKKQIENYHRELKEDDTGTVISVGDGIALVHGLNQVMVSELVEFSNGELGLVLNLNENHVGVVLMGTDVGIKEGDQVVRTRRIIEVPVGDALLGRVVNALGQPQDLGPEIVTDKTRPIERVAPGIMTRKSVHQPLQTGLKLIDSIIPIGRGQRELIIGDRQTGKTAIAIDTIINQKNQDVLCIYVAIGQKASTVAQVVEKLRSHGSMEYTTVILSSADDLSALQYIAPYAGCAMGEEWMEQGKDVLIIYDDLSKHAIAYRTMSLLLRRPPGREAYPGDVFYLHSRLLERAAKLNEQHGGGSLTALPIIETQAGDISAYIPTNVISITDGQLFLQTDSFNAGIRPAIDTGLSVSRVGSSAQVKAMKQVSGTLKLELAQYHDNLSFAQFGSDLDESTRRTLEHGAKIVELFKQPQYEPMKLVDQIVALYAMKHGYFNKIEANQVNAFEKHLLNYFHQNKQELLTEIETEQAISDDLSNPLNTELEKVVEEYLLMHGVDPDGQ